MHYATNVGLEPIVTDAAVCVNVSDAQESRLCKV
ncbi:hypothetical protein DSM107133_01102 [Pseudosulfitobacter sp. DSM 107133]|nr:hypothetical protein DSM107133_01102 [Pseudosulfitobacter sp. DSM 107133]